MGPSSRMHTGWNRKLLLILRIEPWSYSCSAQSQTVILNFIETCTPLLVNSQIIYRNQILCERGLPSYRTWHNVVWQLSTTSVCEKNINEAGGSLKCSYAAIKLHCITSQQTTILTSNVNYTSGPKCVIKSRSTFPRVACKTSDI
jgi:hypothetical protein